MNLSHYPMKLHKKRPLVSQICLKDLSLVRVVDTLKTNMQIMDKNVPDVEAISFYMMQHGMAEVMGRVSPYEPLGPLSEVVDTYFKVGGLMHRRMFYYLLLICTRESRHVKPINGIEQKVYDTWGPEISELLHSIRGSGSSSAVSKFTSNPPPVTLGKYTDYLEWIFFNGKYSPGYGGKAWGEVAKCLNAFVHGVISGEAMVDTGFTLAHNNGPIFNKGMLYSGYSTNFKSILDVQRGGQIPQLLWELDQGTNYMGVSVPQELKTRYKTFLRILGPKFGGPVDWDAVKALGAVSGVHHFMAMSPSYQSKPTVQEESGEYYFVTPTSKVKKLSRKQLVLGN